MLLMLVASCASPKKFVYLNDMEPGVGYKYDSAHEAVIRPNDRLRITVTCKQPELAIPFNRGNAVNVNAMEASASPHPRMRTDTKSILKETLTSRYSELSILTD